MPESGEVHFGRYLGMREQRADLRRKQPFPGGRLREVERLDAHAVTHEVKQWPAIAGIVLAIGGAVLAARVPERPDHPPPRDLRGCVAFAVAGAIGFGVLLVALPPASEHGRFWALLDARLALVAFLVVLVLGRRESPRVPPAALPRLAVPGLLLIAGTLLYVLATEHGAVSIASVCASLNPVVTVLLSLALLGERVSRTQAAGIAAAIAGVALIAAH